MGSHRVLIVGVSSAIARLVATRLKESGHEVAGIDRRSWKDAPIEVFEHDIRKRAAEDVFRKMRPHVVVHMGTVTSLVMPGEERYRINLGGTRAVFDHCRAYGVEHCIFVGRHTYYGAAADSPLYHTEDEPPMALSTFPELADLVAADLYAGTALWRFPELTTSVLRACYSLGPSGHGTLGTFLKGARVPTLLGYDPLFQFMHESDVASAILLTIEKRIRGVFNVVGPPPVPLSIIVHQTGRHALALPEFVYAFALGRFGLPKLPAGALSHIKYPVIADGSAYRAATDFVHAFDEATTMLAFRGAFPPPSAAAEAGRR
jgi:UDP-glucose 4-epimerase